ncbi:hypothetical protein DENSPDRAFT_843306 [Dentipellis sp. KUC8613]|nr:hypothetical protein DENSPDRAFT_843306 [Dentipellis sp. KUC8613]
MSYHPYPPARDRQASSSARSEPTSAGYGVFSIRTSNAVEATTNDAVQASASYALGVKFPNYQISNSPRFDERDLPVNVEINREIYEAKLAASQGLITTDQYRDVLCAGLIKGTALLDRQMEGIQRAMRGEDSRESIQQDAGFTDAEMDAELDQVGRIIRTEMANERRVEARRFCRAVTRGQ